MKNPDVSPAGESGFSVSKYCIVLKFEYTYITNSNHKKFTLLNNFALQN
jgi:hypothetical protein